MNKIHPATTCKRRALTFCCLGNTYVQQQKSGHECPQAAHTHQWVADDSVLRAHLLPRQPLVPTKNQLAAGLAPDHVTRVTTNHNYMIANPSSPLGIQRTGSWGWAGRV